MFVFSDERADFNLEKRNFPENTLCYIDQGYIFTVNESELAIYNHVFMTVTLNQPKDTETCKTYETKLISSLHYQTTDEFLGLSKKLAYIVLHGDDMECFFSYGFNEKKSKLLYPAPKDRILIAVISTYFEKHFHEILNERQHNKEFSSLFDFLPLITHWKRK